MSKFTWTDMQLCKTCHYADEDPDICKADDKAKEKPSPMYHSGHCSKYLAESKYKRMNK